MKNPAPILLLGYKRPLHLKAAFESLLLNRQSSDTTLYIGIDGPKTEKELDLVEECRAMTNSFSGFKKIVTCFQERNIGLANSVIFNVSQVLSKHDNVIVVEDDLVVSNQFLAFMNSGLEVYADDLKVASIHGYQYPVKIPGPECVFLRGADCWGWATWKDRWNATSFLTSALIEEILRNKMKMGFDLYGLVPNFRMLQNQASCKIDSWAIRWHASMYIQNKLTLYPPSTLVMNCGLDGSGTHEGQSKQFNNELAHEINWTYPSIVKESRYFKNKMMIFYLRIRIMRFILRLSRWPSKLLKLVLGRPT